MVDKTPSRNVPRFTVTPREGGVTVVEQDEQKVIPADTSKTKKAKNVGDENAQDS